MRTFVLPLLTTVLLALVPVYPAAQKQFDELRKRGLPKDSGSTEAVASGDVDGDGDRDLVLGSFGQNRLYLNDGQGRFTDVTATRMPTAGDTTSAAALGDIDGDGDLDMVIGNHGPNRLYLNDGKGSFSDVTAARMPADTDPTSSVALGDVDGDGDLDLVFGSTYVCVVYPFCVGQQNRLYLNNGRGRFTDVTAAQMPSDSDSTSSVVMGDLDGDKDLDLVVGNLGQNRLYLNDGRGRFTDATVGRMPTDNDRAGAVALDDVDGDADLDVIVGNHAQNRLYLNDGKGTYTDATATRMPAFSDNTAAVTLGDVDGDSDLDLVFANSGHNRLYLNDGTGTYTLATAARMPTYKDSTGAAVLRDVDGDGDGDLVFGNFGQNRLYFNDGQGRFIDATAARMPIDPGRALALALGDIDGDSDLDIVFGNHGQNQVYLNRGHATYIDATAARMPSYIGRTEAVALGDVDGDGDLDLVSGNDGPQNRLYVNNGQGRFTDATAGRMPTDRDNTHAVVLGDVDGDGDLDLVFGNDIQQNRLYLNDGKGRFTDGTAGRMPADRDRPWAVALGDVDGDGDTDMVFSNQLLVSRNLGQNRLYLNNGQGRFTDVTAARMPAAVDPTFAVALGDIDGDGDSDLVFGNASQQNRLYLNNGQGKFTDATAGRMPADTDWTRAVVLDDVDGDGDLDTVFGNSHSSSSAGSQNRLYLNDGKGTFADVTAARMPAAADGTEAVALGDVDGDGDIDVVFGNRSGRNRLYLNLHRQLDAPLLLRIGRTYTLEAYARYDPSRRSALPFVSAGTASIPLPSVGMIGIDPTRMLALPPIIISQPAGMGSLNLQVPNLPSIVGSFVYSQAALLPPLAARLTNVTADAILR